LRPDAAWISRQIFPANIQQKGELALSVHHKLRDFVVDFTRLIDRNLDEAATVAAGREIVSRMVAEDDWLPEAFAQPNPKYYQQYLLHSDPLERLSIVSFVWGPGQKTPIHDHTVWGIVGVLRGAEVSVAYAPKPEGGFEVGPEARLERGEVVAVSPTIGDIHVIANAYDDRPSISIHVYGGNIGAIRRSVFDPVSGAKKPFISGYSNTAVPNLWDRSRD
jgi:predicted metal-dependent enzyme (double-stranded beta helix superfamily)